jgi:hypothetical protein
MQMGYREDHDVSFLFDVDEGVWKPAESATANGNVDWLPRRGKSRDPLGSRNDL